MKITKRQLRRLIKEGLSSVLLEVADPKQTLGKMVGAVQNKIRDDLSGEGAFGVQTGEGDGLNYSFVIDLSAKDFPYTTTVQGRENSVLTDYVRERFDTEKEKEENIGALAALSKKYNSFTLPVRVIPVQYTSGEEIEF